MNDEPFFPFTLNRKRLTRTRIYLHFGAEQDLQNWWNFWHKSDMGGSLEGHVQNTHWFIKTVTDFTTKVNYNSPQKPTVQMAVAL
jgi:hypothetical protein